MSNSRQDREPNLNEVASLFKDYSGDETGGQHAIRGFSFQVWQAVLEALRAHSTGEDYAVVLEYQQDIALLDSSTSPKRVKFTQLKKNESSGHWTLTSLLTPVTKAEKVGEKKATTSSDDALPPARKPRKKAPPQSILAKLYFHRRRFADLPEAAELVFTSNAPFTLGVGDNGKDEKVTEVLLDELPKSSVDKIVAALRTQLEVPDDEPVDIKRFSLQVTNCPIEEAHKFAIGELVQLCTFDKMGVKVAAPFVAVCLLASYVQQRAGKGSFAKDFNKLLSRAVTRADVTTYFAAANDSHIRPQDVVEQIIARLNTEGADFDVVDEMERSVNAACAEVTNRAGSVWTSARELFRLFEENGKYVSHGPGIKQRMPAWLADFRDLKVENAHLYDNGFLYCLMAMIIKNANPFRHLSTPAASSHLEAKP